MAFAATENLGREPQRDDQFIPEEREERERQSDQKEHDELCPSRSARQQWQLDQESNLAYVEFTRAQSSLTFVG